MSDGENGTATKFSQLVQYILAMEHRLNDLNDRFNNRPELQQLKSLQATLAQVKQQLDEHSTLSEAQIEAVNLPVQVTADIDQTQQLLAQGQFYKYQLVFERSGSRAVLLEALEKTQQRLIIVCPWLSRNSIDADLLQKFRDCLDRSCCIEIGWGYLGDRTNIGKGWRYNALADLRQLELEYPDQFKLKLMGTHEKFLVCDRTNALLGSHNLLASGTNSAEREIGINTNDPQIIQGLIDRFDDTQVQELGDVDETQAMDFTSYDDTAGIETVVLGQPDANFESFDIELDTDESISAEQSQKAAVATEDFLRRYNLQERDFIGIDLARVDLSGKILSADALNLSRANLTRAKLVKAQLDCINLTGANLKNAELGEAQLHQTNLNEANLESADLCKVNLYGTKLVKANLRNANLSGVNLSLQVDLTEANLNGANLSLVNLRKVKLTKVDLRNTNLSKANLLEANLESANMQRVKLHGAFYNIRTVFPIGFNPSNAGAYLITPNTSLEKADLSNLQLSGVNLTGANLQGANLNSTDLSEADLSQANLSKATFNKARLMSAKLLQANLEGANLSEVNLNCANLTAANLVNANLIQANLDGANLTAADLSKANLKNTNLHRANFSGAILTEVNLVGITFKGNFSGADLSNANLCGADLSNANLSGATLSAADLRGACLYNANLEKANLKEAKLGGANLTGAKLSGTIMPDGTVHE